MSRLFLSIWGIFSMTELADQFSTVAAECARSSTEALGSVEKFVAAMKQSNKNREGISLLEVKNREMLAYISELTYLMERMSAGQSIAELPAILRAAKHRTVLERLRPIEDKMKTQIDKLTQAKEKDADKTAGPLKARLDQMELDGDSDGEENSDVEEGEEKKTKKYVPPKMMAVRYEEEEDVKGTKIVEKARRRAMQSSLIQELKQQYSEAPEEYREVSQRKHELDKRREEWEEDNLVRIRVTRADRAREAKMTRDNAVDDLLNFGNYMMRGEDGEGLNTTKRKGSKLDGGRKAKVSRFDKKKINKAKGHSKQKRIKRRQ